MGDRLQAESRAIMYASVDPDVGENVACELASVAIRYRYGISTQLVENPPASDMSLRDVHLILSCHDYENEDVEHSVPYLGHVISSLQQKLMPAPEIFDLAPGSPLFHRADRQCSIDRWELPGTTLQMLYRVIPLTPSTEDWYLFVESPITAVEIQRRGWGPTITDVARELLRRGMPFRTFRHHLRLRPTACLPVRGLGVYPKGYKPTLDDYHQYELRRNALLQHSYAHVALSMGGIIWRLAVEALGLDLEWTGPSCSRAFCNTLQTPSGTVFEDRLTDDEVSIICGVYRTLTSEFVFVVS